jgi:predicted anti-sigma-YlaC factor YlaD
MRRSLDCNQIVELVTAYLDGGLKRRERNAFERHLAKCDGCTNYIEQIRLTIETVGRVTAEDLPPELRENLVAAFRDWRAAL